ncbi:thioredoxin family protein [Hymenobacter nivis]|nr:thioredoxin family protein [Hymenobacter nivis]
MTEAHRQHVHHANDEQLRYLIHENLKVFAKFTSENCAVCSALAPPFAKFVDEEEYQSILFLKLNSDENPVAKKLMRDKATPFFVSYCQGRLLECAALTEVADVRAQLDRLRAFAPIKA